MSILWYHVETCLGEHSTCDDIDENLFDSGDCRLPILWKRLELSSNALILYAVTDKLFICSLTNVHFIYPTGDIPFYCKCSLHHPRYFLHRHRHRVSSSSVSSYNCNDDQILEEYTRVKQNVRLKNLHKLETRNYRPFVYFT